MYRQLVSVDTSIIGRKRAFDDYNNNDDNAKRRRRTTCLELDSDVQQLKTFRARGAGYVANTSVGATAA